MSHLNDLLNLQNLLKNLPTGGVWKYHHESIASNSLQVNWGAILAIAIELGQDNLKLQSGLRELILHHKVTDHEGFAVSLIECTELDRLEQLVEGNGPCAETVMKAELASILIAVEKEDPTGCQSSWVSMRSELFDRLRALLPQK